MHYVATFIEGVAAGVFGAIGYVVGTEWRVRRRIARDRARRATQATPPACGGQS